MELEITINNIQDIKRMRIQKGYIALFHSHNCGHCVFFMKTWISLKRELSDKYQFVELEYGKMQYLTKNYNIKFSKVKYFPYICVYTPAKKEHIEYKERDRSKEELTKFIKSNLNELLPTELNNDNIINNLHQATRDDKKGFIILVHWNRCGHCIKFIPLWNKLKEIYNNRVQFFELEKEELDKIREKNCKKLEFLNNVRSFPSIIIYNNDSENYIKFEDERTMDNLTSFIEKELL